MPQSSDPAGRLRIEVWADLICPWCYIGKRRLEAALAKTQADADIVWRSFELAPNAGTRAEVGDVAYLAKKYRIPAAQAQKMIDNVTGIAAGDGLEYHLERTRTGNSFDGHRIVHLGLASGVQDAVMERLMRAHFTEGRALDDHATLVELAVEAGLTEATVREVLAGDRHASDVRADEARARELGITGVPFFVLAGRIGVSGAQPAEVLAQAITQARG
ncbi:MAG TPA: DsbA family oxidoreductase [Kofleriaceae bacterium]|nr:DsbA family oxidoreductase [Kofleriaceae bacterium]